uniref:beta-ketoacyl-[acyl-carrier-protein] synthase III n=1 Tax=Kalanchoe fedtschenkoi TaxID=63787 RepID=A0A7N0TIZ6_KALFE
MAGAAFISLWLNVPNPKQSCGKPCGGFSRWGSGATAGRVACSSFSDQAASQPRSLRLLSQGCKIVGCGSALPTFTISNDDLAKYVDTSDEWISSRTGIRKRRIITGKETLNGLALEAAHKALEMAKVDPADVDLILVGSSTPDDLFGGGPQIQNALGCKHNPVAYDIRAGCSGFMLALVSAACHIRGGGFNNVVVIGADAISRFVNWDRRETCILFGDAAAAVLLQGCPSEEDGLLSFDLHSDGDGSRHITAPLSLRDTADDVAGRNESRINFPPKRTEYSTLNMNGNEVFKFVCRQVPPSVESALRKADLSTSDVDWLLLHQANQRIMDAVASRLEIPPEKVISNLANYGNTSAASIPLALDEAVRSGKIKAGDTIAAAGFGAGLTWGSAIIRWG